MSDQDTRCGCSSWYPARLQRYAKVKNFLVIFITVQLFRGAFQGYYLGVISTIERRFELSSQAMGMLLSYNDMGHIVVVVLIAYYGGRRRKPLFMGSGMIIVGLSLVLFAMPHFVFSAIMELRHGHAIIKSPGDNDNTTTIATTLCQAYPEAIPTVMGTSVECREHGPKNFAYVIFVISEILNGAGGAGFYSLGLAYLDDNVQKEKAPVYLGRYYFSNLVACSHI